MASRTLSDLLGTLKNTFRIARATFNAAGLTAPRTITLPDKAGTLAMLDDVTAGRYTARRDVAGATDTPTSADVGGLVVYGSAVPVAVTLDATGFTALTGYDIIAGVGAVTVSGAAGVTLLPAGSQTLRTNGSGASIVYLGSNTFWVIGDLESGVPSGASGKYGAIRTVTGTTDTPTASDVGDLVKCTSASPTAVTAATGAFALGEWFDVLQAGAGQVTITADTGVTLLPSGSQVLRATGAGASVIYLGGSTFWVIGDVETGGAGGVSNPDGGAPDAVHPSYLNIDGGTP